MTYRELLRAIRVAKNWEREEYEAKSALYGLDLKNPRVKEIGLERVRVARARLDSEIGG